DYVDNGAFTGICSATSVTIELKDLFGNGKCNSAKPDKFTISDGTNSADIAVDVNFATGDPQNSGVVLDNANLIRWGIETVNLENGGFEPNSVSIIGQCSANFFAACGNGSPGDFCGALQ